MPGGTGRAEDPVGAGVVCKPGRQRAMALLAGRVDAHALVVQLLTQRRA